MRAQGLHSRTFARTYKSDVREGGVRSKAHLAAQSVDLSGEVAFGGASNGAVARHVADTVEVESGYRRPASHARGSQGRFTARVPGAYDENIEILPLAHGRIISHEHNCEGWHVGSPWVRWPFDGTRNLCYNDAMSRLTSLALAAVVWLLAASPRAGAQLPPLPSGLQQPTGSIAPTSQFPNVVPFEFWNGMIIVRVFVGDGVPDAAIIDTALPLSMLSPEYATKKTVRTQGLTNVSILDRSITVGDAKQHTVRIDRVIIGNVPFGVTNLFDHLSAKPVPDAPPIWLGTSALGALTFTIDPLRREITFKPPNAPLPNKAVKVPFEIKDGRMWVMVKANGRKEFSALVDTTAVGTLIPASAAKALELAAEQTFTTVSSNGKEGKVSAVQLNEIAMGGLKVNDVQALHVHEGDKDACDPELGVIGNDVLLRYKVTFDYGRRFLVFEDLPIPKAVGPAAGSPGTTQPAGGAKQPTDQTSTPADKKPGGPPALPPKIAPRQLPKDIPKETPKNG
jgi:hypothetical protein